MFKNDYCFGAISPADFMRTDAGNQTVYFCRDNIACHKMQKLVYSNARQRGAKAASKMLYAFDIGGRPYYMVHVELLIAAKT